MSSPQSHPPAYTESLGTKMDKLADALTEGHATRRADGVYVDVKADGLVTVVRIDDDLFPGCGGLGPLIADLINSAREEAQAQVEDLVRETWSDPRVADVVEQLGDAPERAFDEVRGSGVGERRP